MEALDTCSAAVQHCLARSVDVEKLALQFALDNRDVHTTLIGTASTEEMNKNITWATDFFKNGFSEECQLALKEVQDILRSIHNVAWPSGLKENDDQ